MKRGSIIKAAGLVTASALLITGCSGARDAGNGNGNGPLREGDKAPDFTLAAADGRTVTLADAVSESDGVVLWFTNLCPGCREKMPLVQRIYLDYGGSVEVLAVSQLGAEAGPVRELIEEYKLTFPFLLDPEGEVTRLYGNEYVPGSCPLSNIFFIDDAGIIKGVTHYPGLFETELKDRVNDLIDED